MHKYKRIIFKNSNIIFIQVGLMVLKLESFKCWNGDEKADVSKKS